LSCFLKKCVEKSRQSRKSSFFDALSIDETWETTIGSLKKSAREKIGATKWRLWDWKKEEEEQESQEPNLEEMLQELQNTPLDEKTSQEIKKI